MDFFYPSATLFHYYLLHFYFTIYIRHQICECIANANQKHSSRLNMECFSFKTPDNRYISFDYEDIYFFQSDHKDPRRIIIYTKIRPYTFYGTLNNISKALGSDFFRCHKSCIINIKNVRDFSGENEEILMKNNMKCPVSFRNKSKLHKAILGVIGKE